MDREPAELRTLDDSLVALHEIFEGLQRAGFTEEQALRIVADVVTWKLRHRDRQP